eukprot:gene4796-9562_t
MSRKSSEVIFYFSTNLYSFFRIPLKIKMSTESSDHVHKIYAPIPAFEKTVEKSFSEYQSRYNESIADPNTFWSNEARTYLTWFSPFHNVVGGSFIEGDINWFSGGKLNACYNCVDKHLPNKADQIAIIWEADEPGQGKSITYAELSRQICRIANIMKAKGVKKGDVVTIYMSMVPELAMVMLACARIGAIHSVVFAGFSADSLRDRLVDCSSRWLFVCDEGKRGGKSINLKETADVAISKIESNLVVDTVFVFKRTGADVSMTAGRDVFVEDLLPQARPYCPPEPMDSEDILFILYTSGSTGKPKGVAHTTAGYLLYAAMTTKHSFDLNEGDIHCCVADCGWVTGHSYTVYGPLVNGVTTVMFESIPTYPNPYRYWDMIQTHKITQFYTAPTAVRALMRYSPDKIADYDLSSLRIIASVGEPINPAAWEWFYHHVGRGKCSLVDTYWQTETGGHVGANLPGVCPMKPGSCAFPYFGIQFAIVDPVSGLELEGGGVEGVLCIKGLWPAVARTVYGDHDRYLNVYTRPYKSLYFTGDGAKRDEDGYYWITGRVDDVINPSGHRIGTAEVESALVACSEVSESAVVGFPHDIKGEGICCYVILKEGFQPSQTLIDKLKGAVRIAIGPIATPDIIVFTDLPKTRSGKIMRRILRKVAAGEVDSIGDVSTLADPSVVPKLVELFRAAAGPSK